MEFIKYILTSDMLCMGERIKKGTFRPTIRTIPYSQITGALKVATGKKDIHAVGHLIDDKEHNKVDYITYAPRDRGGDYSRLPITIEFLNNVLGYVYILKNKDTEDFPEELEIKMGAMKSKGFGLCHLRKIEEINAYELDRGFLVTRIPEEHVDKFDIRKIFKPVYGYLFKPISLSTGVYVRSLFEDSEIIGPKFLIKKKGEENG